MSDPIKEMRVEDLFPSKGLRHLEPSWPCSACGVDVALSQQEQHTKWHKGLWEVLEKLRTLSIL